MSVPGALPVKTVTVPHLTYSKISYYSPKPIVGSKPTLLLINGWTGTVNWFRNQFSDPELADKVNLVALEPLGHGSSNTKNPHYTLWNSAIAFTQVMDALGIKTAVVLGASVGGAIAMRLALHAPQRILGVILVGSTLNTGSRIVEQGGIEFDDGLIKYIKSISTPDDNFSVSDDTIAGLGNLSFGPSGFEDEKKFIGDLIKRDFAGEDGRKRFRQISIGIVTRDSLHLRVDDLKVPVLWIHGANDSIYTEALVKEDITHITNSPDVQLKVIPDAHHAPQWTHASQVNPLIFDFVKKHSGIKDARALREAVGMVDMSPECLLRRFPDNKDE